MITLYTLLLCNTIFAPGNTEQGKRNIIDEYDKDREQLCDSTCGCILKSSVACYICSLLCLHCCAPTTESDKVSRHEQPQLDAFTGKFGPKKTK